MTIAAFTGSEIYSRITDKFYDGVRFAGRKVNPLPQDSKVVRAIDFTAKAAIDYLPLYLYGPEIVAAGTIYNVVLASAHIINAVLDKDDGTITDHAKAAASHIFKGVFDLAGLYLLKKSPLANNLITHKFFAVANTILGNVFARINPPAVEDITQIPEAQGEARMGRGGDWAARRPAIIDRSKKRFSEMATQTTEVVIRALRRVVIVLGDDGKISKRKRT